MLPVNGFALKNAVHAWTSFTPFCVNSLTHTRVPPTLPLRDSRLGGGDSADKIAYIIPTTMQKQVREFLATRCSVLRHVRDAMADSQINQMNKLM